MHIYCPTDRALLLLALPDLMDVLHFISENDILPGISLTPKPRHPINDQISEKAALIVGPSFLQKNLEIDQGFFAELSDEKGDIGLYLARYTPKQLSDIEVDKQTAFPFISLLAKMPKDRQRLAYLRAWQRLMGADQAIIRAVETRGDPMA